MIGCCNRLWWKVVMVVGCGGGLLHSYCSSSASFRCKEDNTFLARLPTAGAPEWCREGVLMEWVERVCYEWCREGVL